MQTSVTRSKLAPNKIVLLSLISGLFLTGCNAGISNQPTSFCKYVDPNSKYYSPNSLSLEQLNACRMQAEKILAIQSLRLQILKQRDATITAANIDSNSGTEISKALNALTSENSQQNSNASPPNVNETNNRQSKSSNRSQASRKLAANQSATRIIAQPTNRATSNESVQQRYLNDASTTSPSPSSAKNKAPTSQYDAEQAARVAKQINSLLQSEAAQSTLNQPKALLPGEETTKLDPIAQINARSTNNNKITENTETNASNAALASQSGEQIKAPTEPIASEVPPMTSQTNLQGGGSAELDVIAQINARNTRVTNVAEKPEANTPNAVSPPKPDDKANTPAEPIASAATNSVSPQTNSTQLNPPTQNTGRLSTDYTSEPTAPKAETQNVTNDINPVAQIIKPDADADANTIDATQNNTQIDANPPTAASTLSESTATDNKPPIENTESQADPLAHLQQNRIENK